ncbi:hypothetical protein DXN05_00195 [Deminuibacter soli]|uniref:Uncharacterized protein n=1 Tax=Deminuibacter soli TaxID=2291815 RepID=A0A3E1NNP1_9BACT|nr:hypothetical protein DXN05_00195 [Deminuibacter soli]
MIVRKLKDEKVQLHFVNSVLKQQILPVSGAYCRLRENKGYLNPAQAVACELFVCSQRHSMPCHTRA